MPKITNLLEDQDSPIKEKVALFLRFVFRFSLCEPRTETPQIEKRLAAGILSLTLGRPSGVRTNDRVCSVYRD
jgi:hypothetical protein